MHSATREGQTPKKLKPAAKRSQFATRLSTEVRRRLEAAAEANQRSLSEEAEARLDRSFQLDGMLGPAIMEMAGIFVSAGMYAAQSLRNRPDWMLTGEWMRDAVCFEYATLHACEALWRQHPTRESETSEQFIDRLSDYVNGLLGKPVSEKGLAFGEFELGKRDRAMTVTTARVKYYPVS